MSKISYRVLTVVEAFALAGYIAWYIWRLQAAHPKSWIVFPIWLLVSVVLHRDTLQTLGWRVGNLWPAIRQGAWVFLIMVALTAGVGLLLGTFHRFPHHLVDARHFLNYAAFCLFQQVALNSYLSNRLQYSFEAPRLTALVAGAVFAALHWPNPVLVPLTFIGGAAMSWLFLRERNILPLSAGQAIIGTLAWGAFPLAWHHGMRVGPGFYAFHPR
jgi:hypothetical protein